MVLQEEVEAGLGARRKQRVAERAGYRHGSKPRRLTLRTGTVQLDVPRARLAESGGSERERQSQLVQRYRGAAGRLSRSARPIRRLF
jgi:transposase-like protein